MRKAANFTGFSVLLTAALLLSLISSVSIKPVSANPGKLMWSIVDTPSPANNIIVPSGINVIAIGSDDRTFYAVDIPNSKIYKSTDGGVTWRAELGNLPANALPVWNLAVAPDDVNFLVAVTDATSPPSGPLRVFASEDGGASWENTNFPPLVGGEYIGCLDISIEYGSGNRDIAVGTRNGGGGGVYVLKAPGFAGWANQSLPASDVVALKFSPTYAGDNSLVVISSSAADTHLHLGIRDTAANTTTWNTVGGYPVLIRDTNYAGSSPTSVEIITADLELPSDFSGQTPSLRRYYVSTDATAPAPPLPQSGVYRVDDTVPYWIKPPTTTPTAGRISSIAYYGTYASGVLLAGEVTAAPSSGVVYIWRASDPTASTPAWHKSDTYKSPSGGGTSGYANAQVAWNSDGTRAYCGTSSANLSLGGTAWGVPGQWPFGYTAAGGGSVALDESAFSVSPYTPAYERLLTSSGKPKDDDVGNIWNQLSLIDTQMGQAGPPFSFLSDVAVLEVPGAPGEASRDYDILYLASVNPTIAPGNYYFDSIWRSTSDPLGRTWERVLCTAATNDDLILRVKQTAYDEETRSQVIAFADLGTQTVGYSSDEGQIWHVNPSLTMVTDLALAGDGLMYILNDAVVYRYEWSVNNWVRTHKENTELDAGHTIAVPLKNPEKKGDEETEDWVIVGEAGPPSGFAKVAWADFSQLPVSFEPPLERRVEVPVPGNVHVIADDKFERNKIIYAASHDLPPPLISTTGKIYRWKIDESTAWDELEPPNNAFYGLAMRNDALYGAWTKAEIQEIIAYTAGVDRTLYPRKGVPPPPEWDYLTAGLSTDVIFIREPSSLKISSNEYNNLWAIDDRSYDWTDKEGCLWAYTDTVAKVGPWTTSPPSGDSIPVDPVSGRAIEVNFGWRQLSYSSVYELQLAKDSDFSIRVLVNENITPADQLSPECYFPAGGLVPTSASGIANWGNLESEHTYYWRVRARGAVTGEVIRSPWSATMYFTVMTGLPVKTKYPTLTLFNPTYGARSVPRSPSFSWSGMPGTTKYEFILAKDAALTQVIFKTDVPTTAYIYDGKLDSNVTYFWQVRAVEPVVSDPSLIGSFTVVAEEKPAPAPAKPSPIPFWVWAVIAICAALMAAIIAFIKW
ncbi:MAG: exo-alpha-sialidase [Chloroflexi bacterium]|nr:exo-alpha-sialidase [Chloroflexota bacterium]